MEQLDLHFDENKCIKAQEPVTANTIFKKYNRQVAQDVAKKSAAGEYKLDWGNYYENYSKPDKTDKAYQDFAEKFSKHKINAWHIEDATREQLDSLPDELLSTKEKAILKTEEQKNLLKAKFWDMAGDKMCTNPIPVVRTPVAKTLDEETVQPKKTLPVDNKWGAYSGQIARFRQQAEEVEREKQNQQHGFWNKLKNAGKKALNY